MNTKTFILTILFFQSNFGWAQIGDQRSSDYQPLKVGDPVPNYTLVNLINYPSKTVRLEDFRGKLLILEFWDSYCTPCIEGFPKMMDLQREFASHIQIILVNQKENVNRVRQFFDKRKRLTNVNVTLPTVCGDTILGSYLFKHTSVPHVVWINKSGIVNSITLADVVNAKNIQKLLNNESYVLPQKASYSSANLDYSKPLFLNGNGRIGDSLLWQTVLSKRVPGVPQFHKISADKREGYFIAANLSIRDLFRLAYDNCGSFYYNSNLANLRQTILEVRDSAKYVPKKDGEMQWQNFYTYQLIAPRQSLQKLLETMRNDLAKYFQLDVRVEKRRMKCLVLSASDTTIIAYKSGDAVLKVTDTDVKLNKVKLTNFIETLREVSNRHDYLPFPIIDETNFKGEVGGMEFSTNVYNSQALDLALQKYKMRLTLEHRIIDVLVISEARNE
ncbi:TlpA family protein disulfide reductase [Fulvivirgaceae bacterium PWU4]|uniref:TlpA family protein disulfide reductase n=1 Tax=Chryseosolibacter histidini TaxID=2782349 RepID=A0AAP2DR93_9BACT|nr:TlpA disulfide reductase family protein [Chryseosolibacter histidini]MBT1701043.1 TlpA family protein disulfide reductase [Chryseosolibacter histidini]